MDQNWFAEHRQEWIREILEIFGYINRDHIRRKFRISTPQASNDLAVFQHQNPGAIAYNKTTKRYEFGDAGRRK